MINKEDLQALVYYPAKAESPVLSIYATVDSSIQNPYRQFQGVIKNMLHDIEKTLDGKPRENFEKDAGRVIEFLSDYEPLGRTLVIFSDISENFFWVRTFKVPMESGAYWNDTPYILPILEAMDEHKRYGVVLLNKEHAQLFTITLGEIEEKYDALAPNTVKHLKTTGRDNLRSQMQLQRTDELHTEWHLKHVAQVLVDVAKQYDLDALILAGANSITQEFYDYLPAQLQHQVAGKISLPPRANEKEIMEALFPLEQKIEREQEIKEVNDLVTMSHKNGRAILGWEGVLHAAEKGRVLKLIYADNFSKRGSICTGCGMLFGDFRTICGNCNSLIKQVLDVRQPLVIRVLHKGGHLEPVRGEAAEKMKQIGEGVGAVLK